MVRIGVHLHEGDPLAAARAGRGIARRLPRRIENTGGGGGAMARSYEAIARLWEVITDAAGGGGEVGFCLDTCHAYSAGEELETVVDRLKAITGRIDLVHCNNSRDEFGSGRDRHADLESGTIDPALIVDVVRPAGAPAAHGQPGPASALPWLRAPPA